MTFRPHHLATPGLVFLIFLMATPGPGVRANTLVADLSKHLVAITTGFVGTDVLLFGSTGDVGDVVVIVRGPPQTVIVRRKSRVAGIWVNTAKMTFDAVPSFYYIAASKPLEQIAPESVRVRHQMGIDNMRDIDLPSAKASPNVAAAWQAGLLRNQQQQGLYPTGVGVIRFLGTHLFRTDVRLPANVPTGIYQVQVFMLRDGQVIGSQTTPLSVSKIGIEAEVFDFAHKNSAAYGLIAILVALVAGWLGHMAFRRT